ncbi:hypothetical protein [Streptomyces tauricus]|uniref:hypothetical protein n=1 Tax=Streptomyces tauricus TaxID=68274 RepID=UPI00167B4F65|nr:hypothetical protein [Streptomyces tauricus]
MPLWLLLRFSCSVVFRSLTFEYKVMADALRPGTGCIARTLYKYLTRTDIPHRPPLLAALALWWSL